MDKLKADLNSLFEKKGFPPDAFFIDNAFAGKKLILYGAGECSHWFVEIVMKMRGYHPVAVLDKKFSSGDSFEGIPAFSPAEYDPTEDEKENAIVIICIGDQKHHDEIFSCLKKMGFRNIILLLDVYEVHNPFNQPEELARKGFSFYLERKKDILTAFELLADDESREIYAKCLQTHMTRKPVPLPMRPRKEQYFPTDVPLNKGHSRFVNCGSYDGDAIRLLNETCGKVDAIACYEPEPEIYKRLSDYLWREKDNLANYIVSFPCALHNSEKMMRFNNATGLGSRISSEGKSWAQCVSIDHSLPTFDPTFICMDVEGVEPEVLKGAEKVLKNTCPDLGICVYHSPDHLWTIPIYLHSLALGYRFYLRNYTTFTGETVLYACCP